MHAAGHYLPDPFGMVHDGAQGQYHYGYMPPQLVSHLPQIGLHHSTSAAANAEYNQHFASLAQIFQDKDLTAENYHNDPLKNGQSARGAADMNICADPAMYSEMRTTRRSWSNLFTVKEITAPAAECSMFSPRHMPMRTSSRSFAALCQSQLPGLSHSSTNALNLPPYYPTSDSATVWVTDVGPHSFNGPNFSGNRGTDVSTEVLRKRSRELNFAAKDPFEQDDFLDSGGFGTPSKLARIPSLLRPFEAPFFFNTGAQESCCKTADGAAPAADIYVPSVCECGTAIVGVWYRNRPYYTHWFRHPRYAALRCMLEQNRCKNKYRPMCGIHASVGLASPAANKDGAARESTTSRQDSATSEPPVAEAACGSSTAPSFISEDNFGAVMSADELLAPKFMSLLCMFQLVKHLDAVGIIYPTTVPVGTAPPNMKIEHVKISAHIDCERSKGFVQYRWYSTDVNDLVDDLTSGDKNTKKVVGCCCLGHWKRKPPGRDSSKSVYWFFDVFG